MMFFFLETKRLITKKVKVMDRIELEDMAFYAYHGCHKQEQEQGNRFLLSLRIEGDFSTPAASDNIEDALNYQYVYQLIKKEMEQVSHLLEHICKRILDALYHEFPQIQKASIKVSKMNPPLGGPVNRVSVSMSR